MSEKAAPIQNQTCLPIVADHWLNEIARRLGYTDRNDPAIKRDVERHRAEKRRAELIAMKAYGNWNVRTK